MIDRDVSAPDGRTLCVREEGDPSGTAVMVLHGMPGSRLLEPGEVRRAQERGIRLVTYDRPGYGGSDRHEGRTVADCAADVRCIAGALGIDRLGVWGHSGGGPHAVACAALLEDLAPAVVASASEAPYGSPGLDYFAGMGELNVQDTELYFSDRDAAYAKMQRDEAEMLAADVPETVELLRTLLAPVDAAVLTGELAQFLVEHTREGLAPRHDGWWDDGVATLGDWGIELAAIRTPVLVAHGRHDRFVPFHHGEWLAAHIPGAHTRFYDDEGHLSMLVNRLGDLFDWLLERLRPDRAGG